MSILSGRQGGKVKLGSLARVDGLLHLGSELEDEEEVSFLVMMTQF